MRNSFLPLALAGVITMSAAAVPADSGLIVAQTEGMERREDRREDRQENRHERQDDRQENRKERQDRRHGNDTEKEDTGD